MASFRGKLFFAGIAKKLMSSLKGKDGKSKAAGFEVTPDMMQMMGGFTILRLSSMIGMAGVTFTKEDLLEMNRKLNKIRKPKKLRNK